MISNCNNKKRAMSPAYDPWDPWYSRQQKGRYALTSVEFTVTNLCNLRCEHCAVGDALLQKEGVPIPVDTFFQKLDEVDTLQTLSITGGEPAFNKKIVNEVIRPILKYAKQRGIYTQLNTNLTLPLSRYEDWVHDIDVLHISYNYRDEKDFERITMSKLKERNTSRLAGKLFNQLLQNTQALAKEGIFISAESFLSPFTAEWIVTFHREIANLGCRRHEVHPLYASDFAKGMDLLSVDDYKRAVNRLLNNRDERLWILFGTLPIFPCSDKKSDLELWKRLHVEESVTVRQDPDGRNRLNVNIFTGDVYITDFADQGSLGNLLHEGLPEIFNRWISHPLAQEHLCYCPQARCLGPNVLVAQEYYNAWDFTKRNAKITL